MSAQIDKLKGLKRGLQQLHWVVKQGRTHATQEDALEEISLGFSFDRVLEYLHELIEDERQHERKESFTE